MHCRQCCVRECHTREALLICSLGLFFLSFFSFVLFIYEVVDDPKDLLKGFAKKPWKSSNCTVLDSGISYLGDCLDVEAGNGDFKGGATTPKYPYGHCKKAQLTDPGCKSLGEDVLNVGRRLAAVQAPPPLHLSVSRVAAASAATRLASSRRLEPCEDVFMSWATVVAAGDPEVMCASSTGIDGGKKVSNTFDFFVAFNMTAKLQRGSSTPCWLLKLASGDGAPRCSLAALQDPRKWVDEEGGWIQIQDSMQNMFLLMGLGFFFVSVTLGVIGSSPAIYRRCCHPSFRGANSHRFARLHNDEVDPATGEDIGHAGLCMDHEVNYPKLKPLTLQDRWKAFRSEVLATHKASGENSKPAPAE